jgi:hypothetical protein
LPVVAEFEVGGVGPAHLHQPSLSWSLGSSLARI